MDKRIILYIFGCKNYRKVYDSMCDFILCGIFTGSGVSLYRLGIFLDFDNNYLHRRLCDLCKVDIGVSENRGGNRAYFQRRNRLPNKQKIYAERA